MICELLFPSSILAVKLNRKWLVIVLEMEKCIYDISNRWLLYVIETNPNPEGVSCHPSASGLISSENQLRARPQIFAVFKVPCGAVNIGGGGQNRQFSARICYFEANIPLRLRFATTSSTGRTLAIYIARLLDFPSFIPSPTFSSSLFSDSLPAHPLHRSTHPASLA